MSPDKISVEVPVLLEDVRVDRAVALLADVSRAIAAEWIRNGLVRVGGVVVAQRSRPLSSGELLEIETQQAVVLSLEPEPDVAVDVVYDDAALIVVDKAADLVVHPGAGRHLGTLIAGVVARYPDVLALVEQGVCASERPGVVHRLDRGTSGLLVIARTEPAYGSLVAQFGARSVERKYFALVSGHVTDDQGIVDAPIGRSNSSPTRMTVSARGRPARTSYEVLERYDDPFDSTLLSLRLETGRTHQIRVHLAAIGHPVVGDERYARGDAKALTMPRLGTTRLFLHAAVLGIDHPTDGAPMRWNSPLPEALGDLLLHVPEGVLNP
jgi:23S rRNA pseudouridine1911/1915/1917 synthase